MTRFACVCFCDIVRWRVEKIMEATCAIGRLEIKFWSGDQRR